MENMGQWLYAEMEELKDKVKRMEEEKRMDEAVEKALYAVFEKRNLFAGYDLAGYLECYVTKMRFQSVPKERMVASFPQLVVTDLCERVQEIARDYADSWDDFEGAVNQEYFDYVDLEVMQIVAEVQDDNKEHVGSLEQVPSNGLPSTQVRAKLEAIIDECFQQDGSLLRAADEDIFNAVYAKLNEAYVLEVEAKKLQGAQSYEFTPCRDATKGACHEVDAIQDTMSFPCPHVCNESSEHQENRLQACRLDSGYKGDEDTQGICTHMYECSSTIDWKDAHDDALQQENNISMQKAESYADVDVHECGPNGWDSATYECKCYDDDVEREVNAIFAKHVEFHAIEMQRDLKEDARVEGSIVEQLIAIDGAYGVASVALSSSTLQDASLKDDTELMALLDDAAEGFHMYTVRDKQQKEVKQQENGDDEELLKMLDEVLVDFMHAKGSMQTGLQTPLSVSHTRGGDTGTPLFLMSQGGSDTEGVCEMADSNRDTVFKAACQVSLELGSLGMLTGYSKNKQGHLGMLTGYSNDQQGDAICSTVGLLNKKAYEQLSLAWKHSDNLKRGAGKMDMQHVKASAVLCGVIDEEVHDSGNASTFESKAGASCFCCYSDSGGVYAISMVNALFNVPFDLGGLQQNDMLIAGCFNAALSGSVQEGHSEQALNYFEEVHREGILVIIVTYMHILKAFAR